MFSRYRSVIYLLCLGLLASNAPLLVVGQWTIVNGALGSVIGLGLGFAACRVLKENSSNHGIEDLKNAISSIVFENSRHGVFACEINDNQPSAACVLWSDEMRNLTGYDKDEIEAVGWRSVLYPDWDYEASPIGSLSLVNDTMDRSPVVEERLILTSDGTYKNIRISTYARISNGQRFLFGVVQGFEELQMQVDAMSQFAREFSVLEGKDFYFKVCEYLLQRFGLDFAFIGSLTEDENSILTEVVVGRKGKLEGMTYELANTPCEHVVGRRICSYAHGVQQDFPKDEILARLGVTGYVGAPLFARSGKAMGILTLLSRKPLENEEQIVAMLRLISDRVSSEMERTQSVESIKRSEANLTLALESAQMGTWSWDITTNELVWSQRTERIFGYGPGAFGGTFDGYERRLHPDDRDWVLKEVEDIMADKSEGFQILHRLLLPSGETRWVQGFGQALRDRKGSKFGMAGTVVDVTDRVETEAAVRRSQASLDALIDNTLDLIVAVDTNYRITTINESQKKEYRRVLKREIDVGDSIIDCYPVELRSEWKERYDRVYKGERFSVEFEYPGPKGSEYYEVSFNPIVSEENVVGASVFSRLVTRYKRIQAELIAQKEKAEESDRLKSAFLANMSHEIRTPLNAIMGFAQLLPTVKTDADSQCKFIEIIQANGNHLLGLISDMIDVAQIETNQLSIHSDRIDLGHLMNGVYLNFEHYEKCGPNGPVRLILDRGDCERRIIYGDEVRLRQILYNLLKNAIKFTEEGEIRFGCRELDEETIEFEVSDTGKGIATENLNKIFERFVQVDSPLVREFEGAGLGLAICRGLVELMGGDIFVESKEGVGSRFVFTIRSQKYQLDPENEEVNSNLHQMLESKNSEFGNDARILVVEDNDSNFTLLEHTLAGHPFELIRACDGVEAVEIAKRRSDLDMVLMDIRLPRLNGYEATRRISRIRPELPVIVQSAFAMKSNQEQAFEAGCKAFISKPIDTERLLSLIDEHL